MADCYLGKYKTILYMSIVYSLGNIVLSVTAIPGFTGNPPHWWGAFLGLFLIAFGTGGLKPNISSMGGDQFRPSQTRELQTFFAFFYFSINAGSVLSTFITPELRSISWCVVFALISNAVLPFSLGQDSCFPLAFGIPAVLMIIATLIFVSGYFLYIIIPPSGNIIFDVFRLIRTALTKRRRLPSNERTRTHWLDYAKDDIAQELIDDTKSLLAVLYLFIPLPLYWTLFDQQSSEWVYQAQKMDNKVYIGVGQFVVKPEQMQLVNALLILILIPLFDRIIYPFCSKIGHPFLPLKRMVIGIFFTFLAFVVAGIVEISIDRSSFNEKGECVQDCVSIFWQLPQYFIITSGEILFSITGLEFGKCGIIFQI